MCKNVESLQCISESNRIYVNYTSVKKTTENKNNSNFQVEVLSWREGREGCLRGGNKRWFSPNSYYAYIVGFLHYRNVPKVTG